MLLVLEIISWPMAGKFGLTSNSDKVFDELQKLLIAYIFHVINIIAVNRWAKITYLFYFLITCYFLWYRDL